MLPGPYSVFYSGMPVSILGLSAVVGDVMLEVVISRRACQVPDGWILFSCMPGLVGVFPVPFPMLLVSLPILVQSASSVSC